MLDFERVNGINNVKLLAFRDAEKSNVLQEEKIISSQHRILNSDKVPKDVIMDCGLYGMYT